MASVIIPQSILKLDSMFDSVVRSGVEECTADLFRVASLRAPVDSTTLEKSGTSKVEGKGKSTVGQVSFNATNKGYNYSLKMDKGKYNLGDKSIKKSTSGVRSKFTSAPLPVGSGFLTDTATKCEKGYSEHIQKKVKEAIRKSGLNK